MTQQNPIRLQGNCMEPFVPEGSFLDVHTFLPNDIAVGDLILHLDSEGRVVAHRVWVVVEEDAQRLFFTQNDQHSQFDEVPESAVVYVVDQINHTECTYRTRSVFGRLVALGARSETKLGRTARFVFRSLRYFKRRFINGLQ